MLVRPNVSNITKLILLFSVKDPKLNAYLIDSFLVMANKNNIDVEYALGGLYNQIFASKYVLYMPDKEQLISQVERVIDDWHKKEA